MRPKVNKNEAKMKHIIKPKEKKPGGRPQQASSASQGGDWAPGHKGSR